MEEVCREVLADSEDRFGIAEPLRFAEVVE
jgi:hypothetical protein